ncbi:hypothetical protein [Limnoglobus roseus]|uniref:Uncharacterized protein n=1 Tax=Limnoglobus roseus TaxID=2598579 RepID=A0A5C1A575_9BACT|nr:hypothetical protein [Limnoglobus roseus]QEL13166.1 hypothetical protein PX52LOC_00019 [Limnoglobus roseus]
MSTRKTILVNGGLAAVALAVIGSFFAQIAGMWVASQTPARIVDGNVVPTTDTSPADVTAVLAWRLPLTMAAIGFAIVAVAEGLRSLWKKPPAPAVTPTPTPEVEMQRMLRELEAAPPGEHQHV